MNIMASIIIATYRREQDLVRAIQSVLKQDYKNFELIIVDQSEKHEIATTKFIKSIQDKKFRYYHVSPPSIPAAENFGISKAKGDIVIFIDDDVELDPGFIAEHVKAYVDPLVAGVAGRVKVPGKPESKTLYHITSTGRNVGGFDYNYDSLALSGAIGCNMSFRKSVIKKLGGFDTGYIKNAHRFETDMAYRVMAEGYKITYKTSASLKHYHTASGGSRANSGLFRDVESFANEFRFFYKNLNKRKINLIGFYFIHLVYVIPHPDIRIVFRRLYYLFIGSHKARLDLKDTSIYVVSYEIC